MVTSPHEASHRIFQEQPDILAPVFRILGVPLAEKAVVEVLSPDATEIRPLERRVDSVLRITPPGCEGFLLAIESQGRRDPGKPASWTYYLAHLQAKYDSPVLLLVVCQDKATARWAAGPFAAGVDGWTALRTYPLVLGPGNVPVITDPEEAAQDLTLATFCAMTHGRDPDINGILEALARALGSADRDSARYYAELLEIGLGNTPAKATWKELIMVGTYFPGRGTMIEEAFLEGEAKGEARGRAEGILLILRTRGVEVPQQVEQTIAQCVDLDTLQMWLKRALSVSRAEELFTAPE
ncbi:hypothetical protein [Streptomyces zingiberis]|uniref:Rpn family recombination-promoting nuclease/putative transposase n=1 Tax=Streptomyces zingiberis TaxID=2053010 RepID=A0ABX1C131_9ACTN|nr:hypothetical protein [Streptomyces zingiberis]NJQ03632.1 hypothetical protein [Streptomyces zingiberis]